MPAIMVAATIAIKYGTRAVTAAKRRVEIVMGLGFARVKKGINFLNNDRALKLLDQNTGNYLDSIS
jgi:hypothetical protein